MSNRKLKRLIRKQIHDLLIGGKETVKPDRMLWKRTEAKELAEILHLL